MQATNLYDQMDQTSRMALASMLGFGYAGDKDQNACGFRITLREVPPIPRDNFTMGDALDAYLSHMMGQRLIAATRRARS